MEKKRAKYISLSDAAALCDYSPDYLNLIARKGYLKAIKIGRNWVIKKEWLEDYLSRIKKKHAGNGKRDRVGGDVGEGNILAVDKKQEGLNDIRIEGIAVTVESTIMPSRPPRPSSTGRVGFLVSFFSIAVTALLSFAMLFFSQRDIFIAGVNVSLAATKNGSGSIMSNFTMDNYSQASIGDAFAGAGKAISAAWNSVIVFGRNAGDKIAGFAQYVFFGKTEVVEVNETKSTTESTGGATVNKTVLQEGTNALEENIVSDTRKRMDDFREEFGLSDDKTGNKRKAQGMVVVPAAGTDPGGEAVKDEIKKNFSDEVKVETSDGNSGIIVPQFSNGPGEEYIYMLVPVEDTPK